jgi:hypothetical protein
MLSLSGYFLENSAAHSKPEDIAATEAREEAEHGER